MTPRRCKSKWAKAHYIFLPIIHPAKLETIDRPSPYPLYPETLYHYTLPAFTILDGLKRYSTYLKHHSQPQSHSTILPESPLPY